jgi:hypothetical protein
MPMNRYHLFQIVGGGRTDLSGAKDTRRFGPPGTSIQPKFNEGIEMNHRFTRAACAAAVTLTCLSGCAAIDQVSDTMAGAVGVDPRVMALRPVVSPLGFGVETNRSGGAGGLLLTRSVSGVNVAAGFSLTEGKVMNVVVAGVVIPLGANGQLAMDNDTRANLLSKGVPADVIVQIEGVVNRLVKTTKRG